MEIEILTSSKKSLVRVKNLSSTSTVYDIKKQIHKAKPEYYPDRQSLKSDIKGKTLKDEETIKSLGLSNSGQLYFKDLGPQIGWKTVFLAEYAGPLAVYLLFYTRPALIYGYNAANTPRHTVQDIAAICWSIHYVKRLLETIFVHRFSHSTMPIFNLFKNCGYYWGFAGYVSYFVNHPLYTEPMFGWLQILTGLFGFIFCELGNFSIHIALRNLRPPGTKERKIPVPTSNVFTHLFDFVSCPNYTYEAGAWTAFTVMTQCLPAGMFAAAGFYQMAMWALGKHRLYKKDFSNYPKARKAILPFII